MATALEISFNDPLIEAKFQALRNLQNKKIKSLMTSIDNLQREVSKHKVLGKDNRRSQMIQVLKKKVRDLELVCDVLKEELCSKQNMSRDQVNEFVIKKTISGPKRFRPLTREELETQIADLEKKVKRLSSNEKSAAEMKSVPSTARSAVVQSQSKQPEKNIALPDSKSSTASEVVRIAQLTEELQHYRKSVESKEEIIHQLQEDVTRLRARNAELRIQELELEIKERSLNDLRESNRRITDELDDVSGRLLESQEEIISIKAEADLDIQQQQVEITALQEQCERLLKQNATLLRKLTEVENRLVEKNGILPTNTSITTTNTSITNQTNEMKIGKLQEKLKASEDRILSLTKYLDKANGLKDTLRDKNEEIRELKRIITELQRVNHSTTDKDRTSQYKDEVTIAESKSMKSDIPNNTSTTSNITISKKSTMNQLNLSFNELLNYQLFLMENAIEDGLIIAPPSSLKVSMESLLKESSSSSGHINEDAVIKLIGLISAMDEHYVAAGRSGL